MLILENPITVALDRSAAAVAQSDLPEALPLGRRVPPRQPALPLDQSVRRRQPVPPSDRSVLRPGLPALRPGQSSLPHRPARQQACFCS